MWRVPLSCLSRACHGSMDKIVGYPVVVFVRASCSCDWRASSWALFKTLVLNVLTEDNKNSQTRSNRGSR